MSAAVQFSPSTEPVPGREWLPWLSRSFSFRARRTQAVSWAGHRPVRATKPAEHVALALRGLQRFEKGWDGRFAEAADKASFDDALSFVYLLGERDPMPEAEIYADGMAVLTFEFDDKVGSLRFLGRGVIAAYVRNGDVEWDDDIRFDGERLPDDLAARLGLEGVR